MTDLRHKQAFKPLPLNPTSGHPPGFTRNVRFRPVADIDGEPPVRSKFFRDAVLGRRCQREE